MTGLLDDMKHGLGFLMFKSKTLLDDPKIGSKIVKENTTSFSKLFGDTIAKGMTKVLLPPRKHGLAFFLCPNIPTRKN
jgi:hypothetical protein